MPVRSRVSVPPPQPYGGSNAIALIQPRASAWLGETRIESEDAHRMPEASRNRIDMRVVSRETRPFANCEEGTGRTLDRKQAQAAMKHIDGDGSPDEGDPSRPSRALLPPVVSLASDLQSCSVMSFERPTLVRRGARSAPCLACRPHVSRPC